MTDNNDDYVYDEDVGEWRPVSEIAADKAKALEVRDASGNLLANGDSVVLIAEAGDRHPVASPDRKP